MSVGWSADFSYGYFRRILQAIQLNFESHLLAEVPEMQPANGRPQLLLRHDVDVSLEKALEMAKIEREFGIHATYMVIPNSPFYWLEDGTAQAIFRQLISMGHEVALHFDVSEEERKNNCGISSVEQQIEAACKRLEQAIAQPIRSISFHRPMPQFLHGPLMICGRVNAYAHELMRWYLSDSKGCWREGEPLPKLLKPEKPLLQLLIHPIWWGDQHISREDRLQEFFNTETHGGRSRHYSEMFDANLAKTTLVRDIGGFINRRHDATGRRE